MPETVRSKSRERSAKIFTGVLLVGIFALSGLWIWMVGAVFGAEDVDAVAFVDVDGRPSRLYVTEGVSHLDFVTEVDTVYSTRLAVYDLETGARVSMRVVGWMSKNGASITPIGPAAGGLWLFDSVGGVQLVAPQDGTILRTQEQLLTDEQGEARLRSGDLHDRIGYLEAEQAVALTLKDGSRLRLDERGAAPFEGEVPRFDSPSAPGTQTTIPLGSDRHGQLAPVDGGPQGTARLNMGDGPIGPRYLRAYFVQSIDGEPVQLQKPRSAYVLHASTLDADSPSMLSRVDLATGEPVWSVELDDAVKLRLAQATEDLLCLVFLIDGETTLFGFEHATGVIRYRADLN